MPIASILDDLAWVTVSQSEGQYSHGPLKNRRPSHALPAMPNISPSASLAVRLCGFDCSSTNSGSFTLHPPFFSATTMEPYHWPTTLPITRGANTSTCASITSESAPRMVLSKSAESLVLTTSPTSSQKPFLGCHGTYVLTLFFPFLFLPLASPFPIPHALYLIPSRLHDHSRNARISYSSRLSLFIIPLLYTFTTASPVPQRLYFPSLVNRYAFPSPSPCTVINSIYFRRW